VVVALVLARKATEEKLAKHGIKNVHVLEADVTDRSALLVCILLMILFRPPLLSPKMDITGLKKCSQKAAEETEKITGGKGVDVFINNAGLIAKPTAFRTLKD